MNLEPKTIAKHLAMVPWKPLLQRLLGVWNLSFVALCFFGPTATPVLYAAYSCFLHIVYVLNTVRTFRGTYQTFVKSVLHSKTDWLQRYCDQANVSSPYDPRHDLPYSNIMHIIIIPNYKESFNTICETLDVLASHEMALTQYTVCLAMEQAESDSAEKARKVLQIYQDSFYRITFTIHPANQPGEARGKASNINYAAREMARIYGVKSNIILTIMDADTCFAQDYFTSVTYYYALATPEDREISFYSPPTLFDRNAHNVPHAVRAADLTWSAACTMVLSTGHKFPCSAYSISFMLAHAVGYWDTDNHAVAEDMHMYTKCYYATEGRLKATAIFSPASQCNVQGDTYLSGMVDRYSQAKRHMWASLEVGYAIRRAIFGLFAPGYDAPNGFVEQVPLIRNSKLEQSNASLTRLVHWVIYQIIEANMFMGQVFMLVLTSMLIVRGDDFHPFVLFARDFGGWTRFFFMPVFLLMLYQYTRYHQWCGEERWKLSMLEQMQQGSGQGVQPLGKRSQLVSIRKWYHVLDFAFLPISGFLYLTLPQLHAQIIHLFTDNLDYKVAGKPTIEKKFETFPASTSTDAISTYAEEGESSVSLATRDSGFYEFQEKPGAPYSPNMWNTAAHDSGSV